MTPYRKKYIITGAPGTGKTCLLDALGREYSCMPEVSRKVISSQQEIGGSGTPWQNVNMFVELVYGEFITSLSNHSEAIFTDRSILDLIAYLQVEGMPVDRQLIEFSYLEKFHKQVFFAPTWESIYQKDEQRQQEFSYGLELEKALQKSYSEMGFELILLPKEAVDRRVDFVKSCLRPHEKGEFGKQAGESNLLILNT